mgnify:CR=1 FL=1
MPSQLTEAVTNRAAGACEVCTQVESSLVGYEVSNAPSSELGLVAICKVCEGQLSGRLTVEPKHWFCLQESMWSEVGAIQVLSYRQLDALKTEAWARDALASAYLEDELMQWAEAGLAEESDSPIHRDMNGTQLFQGDSITLTRSLDVKGTNFTVKRGDTVKNIRLSDDVGWVDAKVNGVEIFIKTSFVKKVHQSQ